MIKNKSFLIKTVFSIAIVMSFCILSLSPIFKTHPAFACPERQPAPNEEIDIKEEFKTADVVFVGEVVSVTPKNSLFQEVEFDVEKSWKGVSENKTTVSTDYGDGSCAIDFKKGEKYVVYAKRQEWNNEEFMYTNKRDDRTVLLANAKTDVLVLNNLTGSSNGPVDTLSYLFFKISTSSGYFLTALFGGCLLIVIVSSYIVYKIIKRKKSQKIQSK